MAEFAINQRQSGWNLVDSGNGVIRLTPTRKSANSRLSTIEQSAVMRHEEWPAGVFCLERENEQTRWAGMAAAQEGGDRAAGSAAIAVGERFDGALRFAEHGGESSRDDVDAGERDGGDVWEIVCDAGGRAGLCAAAVRPGCGHHGGVGAGRSQRA